MIFRELVIVPKNKNDFMMQEMKYLNTYTEWNNIALSSNDTTFESLSVMAMFLEWFLDFDGFCLFVKRI